VPFWTNISASLEYSSSLPSQTCTFAGRHSKVACSIHSFKAECWVKACRVTKNLFVESVKRGAWAYDKRKFCFYLAALKQNSRSTFWKDEGLQFMKVFVSWISFFVVLNWILIWILAYYTEVSSRIGILTRRRAKILIWSEGPLPIGKVRSKTDSSCCFGIPCILNFPEILYERM